LMQT
jgi:hypothetical protein